MAGDASPPLFAIGRVFDQHLKCVQADADTKARWKQDVDVGKTRIYRPGFPITLFFLFVVPVWFF